ncbi:MAG: heme exporter protein CcmD [Cardiobacteriaceae bacterium]|nr:heme exporter protein CcmD [Cardiobacteriaceae bacterium]
MTFSNISEFLHMGTHGAYVWTAYGLTFIALIAIHCYTNHRRRRLQQTLKTLKHHDETH